MEDGLLARVASMLMLRLEASLRCDRLGVETSEPKIATSEKAEQ